MAITSNRYFRAGVEFVHDIAAGVFPGAVLSAWLIRQGFLGATPDTLRIVEKAALNLWPVLLGCLIALGLTGGLRLTYWRLNVREGFLETKARMIVVKHTAFTLTLIGSIASMFTLLPA